MHTGTYCTLNNSEFVPEVANEFVVLYMKDPAKNKAGMQRNDIIDLTQHLCHWLFVNRLTCSKLIVEGVINDDKKSNCGYARNTVMENCHAGPGRPSKKIYLGI